MSKPKKVSRLSVLLSNGEGSNSGAADWSQADSDQILSLIANVGSRSGAIRFGYTRDGGAYAVGIYLDDDNATFYCKPSDDLGKFIGDLLRGLEAL